MPSEPLRRSRDQQAVVDFVESVRTQFGVMLIHGEAGIGKTTLWLDCLDLARRSGVRVLSARAGQLETVLAYTCIGDLLADVESSEITAIPVPQRQALNRVLLLENDSGPELNHRLVATAFGSVVDALAEEKPTLIAIDDVQWLDSSSRAVLAYVLRRMKGRVGAVFTQRDERDRHSALSWLQSMSTDPIRTLKVSAMTTTELHVVIERRLGRSFPRPTMSLIAETSGGNPLYAIELARAANAAHAESQPIFPRTLAELVENRIRLLGDDSIDVLLAASCVHAPTIDSLAEVLGRPTEQVIALLEEPETSGIVTLNGNLLGFTHPILARGVYLNATAVRRRHCHNLWSQVVTEPEARARHLAFGAVESSQDTLDALDIAAAVVRARGAPRAAAELLDLAIGLGGDTPMRRFAAAEHHLRSGDAARAQAVLQPGIAAMPADPLRALMKFGYAVIVIHTEGYTAAAAILQEAISDASDTPAVQVVVRMMLAFALVNDGSYGDALRHARDALTGAESISDPALLSQALATWCFVSFLCGHGYDGPRLQRSLELEDLGGDVPIPFQASAIEALIHGWTGHLEQATEGLEKLRRQLVHRGGEIELLFVSYNSALVSLWRGRYEDAQYFADETFQRVEEIGGPVIRAVGLAVRGWVGAHTGQQSDAHADLTEAIESAQPNVSTPWWYQLALMGLGRLHISSGRHADALAALAPLLEIAENVPGTELPLMEYLPDAIEAMIATGQLREADGWIERLHHAGLQHDRSWLILVAGRCRGFWLAESGDVGAALETVEELARLDLQATMPLECARTKLLLGQLRRRRRVSGAARALREALQLCEHIGATSWAELARIELARTSTSRGTGVELTATEWQVAKLAADGFKNREIATAAHLSEKTVEHYLSRVYRKLDIRSRAELARRIDQEEFGTRSQ